MKKTTRQSGFAIAITLVLMALIAIIVVAYLVSTRIERSTAAVHANRMRAKITAESALAAATKLLYDNTKNGNYITAMPPPVPTPSSIRTEIYRADGATTPDDPLTLSNALGDILVSRVDTAALTAPTPPVDPRPTVTLLPAPPSGGSFGMPDPGFTAADSYDFNQIVRVGSTNDGYLVNPVLPIQPAYGQWIRVRNAAGALIGRYAFFIEDESMKVNVNTAGNNLGTAQANLRVNDLAVPPPASTPATQAQEIDPASALPATAAARMTATKALANLGPAGSRVGTQKTVGVLSEWNDNSTTKLSDYAHIITSHSTDDVTTARGWQRMNLNKLVADASTNADKVAAAQKIADWIKDAWTGPAPLSKQETYQIYSDDRLRLQLAANIVDYIDADDIPTDMGSFPPNDPNGIPVIGIEKIPYVVEVDATYKSVVTKKGEPEVPDSGSATITIKLRINFQNLFDKDLRIEDYIGFIKIKGIPKVIKEGKTIINHTTETIGIPVASTPTGADVTLNAISGTVPWAPDNSPDGVAGVKTFEAGIAFTDSVQYTPSDPTSTSESVISTFPSGILNIEVYGKNSERLDITRVALSDRLAKLDNSKLKSKDPKLPQDFLENSSEASSINAHYELLATGTPFGFGDPRYRPSNIARRWYTVTRTDTPRLASTADKADMDPRAYSVDWYDYKGNRPLLFHRNGPMLSIGELGNVSACEYPWRTVYLQYGGRLHNTNEDDIIPFVKDRRGSSDAAKADHNLLPQDYVLMDLFTISGNKTRSGSINVNTQANIKADGKIEQGTGAALFLGVPEDKAILGTGNAAKALDKLASALANRRIAGISPADGTPGTVVDPPPVDNDPRHPYFTIGEVASDISRLLNQNINDQQSVGGRTHTKVVYSVLRKDPTSAGAYDRNYGSDMQVEEPFRKICDSITTRGNIFRVLFVGQAIKDLNKNGVVDSQAEVAAEYLGEAFIEREAIFGSPTVVGASTVTKTSDSRFKIIAQRTITE